ncbi:MAG: hypothetical protein ACLQUY_09685 [Ktedonobacterales bacterium]
MADASHLSGDTSSMDWIVPFYGWRGARMGPTGIFDRHRGRTINDDMAR